MSASDMETMMRPTIMGAGLAALMLSASMMAGGAMAQTSDTSAPAAGMATSGQLVTGQGTGEFRASKFVGVDVYGSENEKIGDISEVILDDKGMAKAVVIGVGGFLGMGQKSIALPWSAVTWSMEPPPSRSAARTEPTSTGSTGMPATRAPTAPGTTAPAAPSRSLSEQAAYNGYPDHGKVALSKAQLESAPAFQYFAEKTSGSAPAPRR